MILRLEQDRLSMLCVYDFFCKVNDAYLLRVKENLKYYLILLQKLYCLNNKRMYLLRKNELQNLNIRLSFKEKLITSNYYLAKILLQIKKNIYETL